MIHTNTDETSDAVLEEFLNNKENQSYFGWIVTAGNASEGQRWVQFHTKSDKGWASVWPEWAYQLAKDALYSGKKLAVTAKGPAFGANLVAVIVNHKTV